MSLCPHELFVDGAYSQSLKGYSRALADCPADATLLCNRALVLLHLELYRKCIKDCDAAIESDPSSLEAYLVKGDALNALKKHGRAQRAWDQGIRAGGRGHGSVRAVQDLMARLAGAQAGASPAASSQVRASTTPPAVATVAACSPQLVSQNPHLLKHGTGDSSTNEQIAAGYLSVNTGQYAEAVCIFSALLHRDDRLVAGFVGRGSALALSDELEPAHADFTRALQLDGTDADVWNRRGQVRAVLGDTENAIDDFSRAILLAPEDPEGYRQRGTCLHRSQRFVRAEQDLATAVRMCSADGMLWNLRGMCLLALGQCTRAIECFRQTIRCDPSLREAHHNMGLAYRDLGHGVQATECFDRVLQDNPTYVQGWYQRGLLRYNTGAIPSALGDFDRGLSCDPSAAEKSSCLYMSAQCLHTMGHLLDAQNCYSALLDSTPGHLCWYQRAYAEWQQSVLHLPLVQYDADEAFDRAHKEGWCKGAPAPDTGGISRICSPSSHDPLSDSAEAMHTADSDTLVGAQGPLGSLLQLHSPGFLTNVRQHRQCGFAILQMAQALVRHRESAREAGSASPPSYRFTCRAHTSRTDGTSYRKLFHIAVVWRQISNGDPVWWVDKLPLNAFQEGFGLQTPMITGEMHVPRYYPYFTKAFEKTKQLVDEQYPLTDQMRTALKQVADCEGLYALMKRDFFVVTPCASKCTAGRVMEGTRITLVASKPEGFEFTIRMPGTPERWLHYEEDLQALMDAFIGELCRETSERDAMRVTELILSVFYFWVVMAPLTRGSAATGYAALFAMALAAQIPLRPSMPPGVQADWEAILSDDLESFVSKLRPLLFALPEEGRRCGPAHDALMLQVDTLPDVVATVPSLRAAFHILNHC